MAEILVFSERDSVAFELLSWGKEHKEKLGARMAAAVLGKEAATRANEYFAYGADKVYLGKDALLDEYYADVYAEALCQIANSGDINLILIGATRRGKELAPRVAQKWGAGCITDAIDIKIEDGGMVIDRYNLGGNTVSSEVITTPKKVISVMPRAFAPGEKKPGQGEVAEVVLKLREPGLKIVEKRGKAAESVDIEAAEVLVCVGRGLGKKEDIAIIEKLAKGLKAEIGCTRPLAHDWQWFSEEREVGLSGKKCKPRLCVSIGISGQIQHTVGIRDSKVIVAINKDKNAPIFGIADYGIIGDLYEVVPKLIGKISNK